MTPHCSQVACLALRPPAAAPSPPDASLDASLDASDADAPMETDSGGAAHSGEGPCGLSCRGASVNDRVRRQQARAAASPSWRRSVRGRRFPCLSSRSPRSRLAAPPRSETRASSRALSPSTRPPRRCTPLPPSPQERLRREEPRGAVPRLGAARVLALRTRRRQAALLPAADRGGRRAGARRAQGGPRVATPPTEPLVGARRPPRELSLR